MLKEVSLNSNTIPYIRACLAQGDTVSQYLLDLPLEQGAVTTFLPPTVNLETITKFEVGGVVAKQQTYVTLANLIGSYFKQNENRVGLFEAIEQQGDKYLSSLTVPFMTHKNEVYYILTNQSYDGAQIMTILQRARSYPFIGILTSALHMAGRGQLESDELKELVAQTDYILVGAYDDEGVLIWRKGVKL